MNKKGFTLIELLAVIVILAIIALIATPIILNMINSAKKSAAKSAALGYIEAIEYNNGFAEVEQPGYTSVIGENLNVTNISIKVKGKKPNSGTVTINSKGKVESAKDLCFNGYAVDYDGKDAKVKGKCSGETTLTQTYTAYQVGDSINYNPVANEACNNPVSTTGTKSGCMKWYVIKESKSSDSTVDVILDHNTTATVAYETSGTYKEYSQASIKSAVETDTAGWANILNPRLIAAQEIADITNTNTFDGSESKWFYFDGTGANKQTQVSSTQGASPYKWLFDYTSGCTSYGCNTENLSTYGYWTSSSVSPYSGSAWFVHSRGRLDYGSVGISSVSGIRPVITISKSELQ